MSMHKIPLTEIEREGLIKHHLPVDQPSQGSDCFRLGVQWALREFNKDIIEFNKEKSALQAKIDALMLEFCPEEMTQEQIERWGKHQVISTHSNKETISEALKQKIFDYYKRTDCNLGK